jgi:hypothetical protein
VRELEFLPAWYPVLRRRRALATAQAFGTAGLMLGLVFWGVMGHQRVMHKQALAAQTTDELRQVRGQLKMLDEQLLMKQQLQQQEMILRRLGLQVDATRMLGEMDELMGKQTFVLELAIDTEEHVRSAAPAVAAMTGDPSQKPREQVERKLRVRLVGVAPSDVDVANFLAGLSSRSYFDQVAMTYARDRASDGRLMREFEVTFLINLNVREPD